MREVIPPKFFYISILIETGDDIMLNEAITPNLWNMFYGNDSLYTGGLCCNHNYSVNHTDASDVIGMNGNHPMFHYASPYDIAMPFNIPNTLGDEYNSYFTTDLADCNDVYKTRNFISKFGFKNYLYHNDVIPEIQPWKYESLDFTRDSLFMNGLTKKIKSFSEDKPFYIHYLTIHMHMDQKLTEQNKSMFDELETEFGEKLDKAEQEGKWKNQFEPNTEDWYRFRRFALKTMDFDKGLNILFNTLYGSGSSDFLKNTLLVVYGDHYWYENSSNGETYAKRIRNDYDDSNIKQYKTVLGLYHPKLSSKLKEDFDGNNFNKVTWPSVIVPTVLNLLGKDYNPRIYEGKSLFDPEYSNNEVFYSNWKYYFFNEHFTSVDGHNVTQTWDDEQSINDFKERLEFLKKQLRVIDTIYYYNIFGKYNYSEFMPKK